MSARIRIAPPAGAPFDRDLEGSAYVIGRSQGAEVIVDDSTMSRRHARLFLRDGRWLAEDLGTTNGTLLNDQQLRQPTPLRAGDRLRVGATTIEYVPDPAMSAAAGDDRHAARLAIVNDVHRALATAISLDALLALILERCFDLLNPEEGAILLRQADGTFAPAATRRLPGATGEVFVSRSLVNQVAGQGKPALVLDASLDERFAGANSIIVSGVRSIVAAPLADADGTLGMIALFSRASVRKFADPDLEMLMSLASAAALRVRNVELAESAAARRVLERELALAHDMQMAMLPRRRPEQPDLDIAATLTPARLVGGDLYDFVVAGDRLWFIVADVSGKGPAAALYMAVAKTLFRAIVQPGVKLPDALARMNRELCRDNDQLVFITALVGHLSLPTGDVEIGDAGHGPALIVRPDGRLDRPPIPKRMALGVMEDTTYETGPFRLERGAALVLYTDGVTEARSRSGELFGDARLEKALRSCGGRPADETMRTVVAAVEQFAAGAPPEDDITLLVVKYLGTTGS
jgi:phosphoserine phosphatase RsbU/P